MAAFIVVEVEVKDEEAKAKYSKAAGPLLKGFGGEFIVSGAWTQLAGEAGLKNGAIIQFEDRSKALAWYNSPEYQAIIVDRDKGMDCRFQIIG
jgi:uncharacterized protein (DUF1330 family)